jgi:bifunctional non-homologous end joining protein LigD
VFDFIAPMIVSIGKEAFDDERFLFEPKWDGYRIQLHKQGDRLEAYTRSGQLVTYKFPELQEAVKHIDAKEAILDCEGICMRDGRPVFDDFAYRGRISLPSKIQRAQETHPATFVVFDVLQTTVSHMQEPLMRRKALLAQMVEASAAIAATMYVDTQGRALSELSKSQQLEGIVAKRKDSLYIPGALSPDWLKIKNWKTLDTVILGIRKKPPFALVVGVHFRTMRNKPVGTVELGFTMEDKERLWQLAEKLAAGEDAKTHWLEPVLCCRIDYLERNDLHQLRMTVFRGLLAEKRAEDCVWPYQ